MMIAGLGLMFWIILFTGLMAVFMFLERMLALRRAQIDYKDFVNGVCNVLTRNKNDEEATMLCEETPGPVAAVALTAITHYRTSTYEKLCEMVEKTGQAEISRLERRVAAIAVTSHIAPLLGLAGTLVGVMRVLLVLNEQAPLVQGVALTAGLMQALVSTVAGLVVAVICYIMHTMLILRIERIAQDMEVGAAEIVTYLMREDKPVK